MAHSDSSANRFLNDLIKGVIMAEISTDRAHLNRPIAIQRRGVDTFL